MNLSNLTEEQKTAISLVGCWWAFIKAANEIDRDFDKSIPEILPDSLVLHFCSHGASASVLAKHLDAIADLANQI